MMTAADSRTLAGMRVLVIEDEYYLADDLSRTLQGAGAEVVGPVATVGDAERMVTDGRFDAAVVDMNLRGDLAFGIAERLAGAGVPLIVTTGYNSDSLPDALEDVPRIEKPFTPAELVDRLSRMKAGRRSWANSR